MTMQRNALALALLAPLAAIGCGSSTDSSLDTALHQEYGALEAEDRAGDVAARERDDGDDGLFPSVCRELIVDVRESERERSADGRELGRDEGTVRDDVDGRTDRVRSIFGERSTGRRVWFARIDSDSDGADGSRRRGLIAGEVDEDGRLTGRVLDRQRRVRGLVVGERDADGNLRARIRLACRDLVNEGEREEHDEDNERARDAGETVRERDARGDDGRATRRLIRTDRDVRDVRDETGTTREDARPIDRDGRR